MTRLMWNQAGSRLFEAGVEMGVLYPKGGPGVAWNGLISVKESSTGGDSTPYYVDGVKYLNVPGKEEFVGNIEAYTYPIEFEACEGILSISTGFAASQQRRDSFDLSYVTKEGNDLEGIDYNRKIHIIYNALTKSSDRNRSSMTQTVDPITFSWDFTTTPVMLSDIGLRTSHVIIDVNKTRPDILEYLETYIYGSSTTDPTLPSIDDLFFLYKSVFMEIDPNTTSGLSFLIQGNEEDLFGDKTEGLYKTPLKTRLKKIGSSGLSILET